MSTEAINKNLENLAQITPDELPEVIANELKLFEELDQLNCEALAACEDAKTAANSQIVAKSHLWGNKKAIESTQDAVKAISEAQIKLTDAQAALAENQKKMAECIRYLLFLGASSINNCKIVISTLEAKLSEASEKGLSQKSKGELLEVIRLLKEQESAITRQERLSTSIRQNRDAIGEIHTRDNAQDARDIEHDKKDEEHDERIDKLKWLTIAALVISGVSLIVSILSFIL